MHILTLILSVVVLFTVTCHAKLNYSFGDISGEVIKDRHIFELPKLLKIIAIPRRKILLVRTKSTITGVELLDQQNGRYSFREAYAKIITGGIGRKFMTIRLKSKGGFGFDYRMRVYSKKSEESTTDGPEIGLPAPQPSPEPGISPSSLPAPQPSSESAPSPSPQPPRSPAPQLSPESLPSSQPIPEPAPSPSPKPLPSPSPQPIPEPASSAPSEPLPEPGPSPSRQHIPSPPYEPVPEYEPSPTPHPIPERAP